MLLLSSTACYLSLALWNFSGGMRKESGLEYESNEVWVKWDACLLENI